MGIMDNLCLIGLGLFGLLFLTSKKEKNVFIDSNNDINSILSEFQKNKYKNELEWVIPIDEVNKNPLHPFAGFDYVKISTNISQPPIFGRYIKLSESLKTLLVKLEPTINIKNTIEDKGDILSLVTCANKFPTISAITLNFAENINSEDLSICKLRNIYKKMIKNYTCKKIIEPPIHWYNQSLWDDMSHLNLDLCGQGDTSSLETSQIMDTDVLENSETSDLDEDSDVTSMDNETELNKMIDSLTSEDSAFTSMDNETELNKMIDSLTSVNESVQPNNKSDSDL